MYARPRARQSPRQARVATWKAPVAGLIANRNLAMPEGPDGRQQPGASVLENFFPTARGCVIRRGSDVYATAPQREGNDEYTKVLLHMDGADASTTFTDSNAGGSAHTWTAAGNAQIDRSESKFGGASGLFDGTGDYISTPDHADFAIGSSDFTIDAWFNCASASGTIFIAGQIDAAGAANANSAFYIRREGTSNVIRAAVITGTTTVLVDGTTQFTDALNPGWHHFALVRTGNVLKLFIDGVQEGGDVAFSASVNNATGVLAVGRAGDFSGFGWDGWIDEFRLSVGIARWTEDFTLPVAAYAAVEENDPAEFLTYNVGGLEQFFVATDDTIYDITTPASPAAVVTGMTSGDWVSVQFSTSGGTFLLAVNGSDSMLIYDGTYWYPVGSSNLYTLPYDNLSSAFTIGETVTGGTSGANGVIRNIVELTGTTGVLIIDSFASGPFQNNETITDGATGSALANGTETLRLAGITGVTTSDLSYVWVYKNRVFFVEKESLSAWYLAIDAIGGAATEFPLGGVFTLGGSLLFGSSWSIESADGLDARCIFVTDGGEEGAEVAVYAGTNPADANLWGLVGVYRTGKPMGKKAHVRAGGDVVIATDLGFIPLSVSVKRDIAALSPSALSFPIEDLWAAEVVRRSQFPWRCKAWPTGRMTVVALPTITDEPPKWFVANVRTGAWAVYTGWDATCLAVFDDRLFFGSSQGRIVEANITGLDQGDAYTATYVPLFEDLNTPASLKVASLARATIRSPIDLDTTLAMLVDFVIDLPAAPAATPVPAGSTWGTAVWGEFAWGQEPTLGIVQRWTSVGNEGYALAPALLLTSGSLQPLDAEIVRIEATYTIAEIVT